MVNDDMTLRLWAQWPGSEYAFRDLLLGTSALDVGWVSRPVRLVMGDAWRPLAEACDIGQRLLDGLTASPIGPAAVLPEPASACWLPTGVGAYRVVGAGEARPWAGRLLGVVGTRGIDAGVATRVGAFLRGVLEALPDARVVSGGAYGCDALAQRVALELGRPPVVLLGGGVMHAGPAGERAHLREVAASGGSVWTCRPPSVRPRRFELLARNAWLARLVDGLVVLRAPLRSGALHTAREVLRLGKPVWVLPAEFDAVDAQGSNRLLARGALPLLWAGDVVERWPELASIAEGAGSSPGPREEPALGKVGGCAVPCGSAAPTSSEEGRRLWDALAGGPSHRDTLGQRLGWASSTLSAVALELELGGWIASRPGGVLIRT